MSPHHVPRTPSSSSRLVAIACSLLLVLAACGSSESDDTDANAAAEPTEVVDSEPTTEPADADDDTGSDTDADTDDVDDPATAEDEGEGEPADDTAAAPSPDGCDEIAALFVTRGSANADLDDPEVAATCEGDSIVITSNGIPDYTYIGTSPGEPTDRDLTFTIPAEPTVADTLTDVPLIGISAVTLGGIPIFGPTEGTGGDVDSLPGILSDCGSHNGPSGFHIHKIMTSSETDCLFTPEEVAAAPQLVGYALDGFPIYTGTDQYTSSWQLTDESLFATDTWAAHTYVEGSGDLDQCNGLTDEDGNYAYYTTATFPYVNGCYVGTVDIQGSGGGGGDAPEGEDRPERPEGDAGGEGGDRPERPEPGEGEGEGE